MSKNDETKSKKNYEFGGFKKRSLKDSNDSSASDKPIYAVGNAPSPGEGFSPKAPETPPKNAETNPKGTENPIY